jgi:hypothetical protein
MKTLTLLLSAAPLTGCTTTYKVHRLDGAEQFIRHAIIRSRSQTVDIKSVGKTLIADFGRHRAWTATLVIWTELTGGAPRYHASDTAWLLNRSHDVQCVAWLIAYKDYWLP